MLVVDQSEEAINYIEFNATNSITDSMQLDFHRVSMTNVLRIPLCHDKCESQSLRSLTELLSFSYSWGNVFDLKEKPHVVGWRLKESRIEK